MKRPSLDLIPNFQWVDHLDETQKSLLIQMLKQEYDLEVNPDNLKTDLQEQTFSDELYDVSDEIYSNFFNSYIPHVNAITGTPISKLSTDLEAGETIIRICPHTGKPVLTRIIDDHFQTLCLHQDNEEEDLKEIYKWINQYYNINAN